MSISEEVARFGRRRRPAHPLEQGDPAPAFLTDMAQRNGGPQVVDLDTELGKLARESRAVAIVPTDDSGPVAVDLTTPPEAALNAVAQMQQTFADHAGDLRKTGEDVRAGFAAMAVEYERFVRDATIAMQNAVENTRAAMDHCQAVAKDMESAGQSFMARHAHFMTTSRNAMAAVLAARAAIGGGTVAPKSADEQARELLSECVGRIEQVAGEAGILEALRGMLDPEAEQIHQQIADESANG